LKALASEIDVLFNATKQIPLFLFISSKQIVFHGKIDVSCRSLSIKDEKN
jgi:hypothetical protein